MKKIKTILTMIVAVVCVLAHYSAISHASPRGVVGSKHDMSVWSEDAGYSGPFPITVSALTFETYEVCVFCHTPHGANNEMREDKYWDGSNFVNAGTAGANQPFMLWNRSVASASTTAFNLYTSSTMTANPTEVWPYSLMCLSCHDGVSAINVLHNYPADIVAGPIPPNVLGSGYDQIGDVPSNPANIGDRWPTGDTGITDLSNDHPVSIDYTVAQSGDAGLRVPSVGYVLDPKIRLFPMPTDADRTNKVALECVTCHDVHNEGSNDSVGPYAYMYPFLVVSNEGSYLCSACHLK